MNYIPEITYGGIDGTITTTAVIAGSMGLGLSPITIVALAFSSIIADGISMAVGSFQSEKTRTHPRNKLGVMMVTFFSFVIFGTLTTIPFIIAHYNPEYKPDRIHILLYISVLLFFIGTLQTRKSASPMVINGIETTVVGVSTAIIAYLVSSFIEKNYIAT